MIKPGQLLSYSLSSILVCSLLSGVGFASHKKKKKDTNTTISTQTTAATQTPAEKNEQPKTSRKTTSATTSTVSASDIANAKAKGLVWVNTESKVYHSSGRYYGNTKHGQFMSEAAARKAGFKAAKR